MLRKPLKNIRFPHFIAPFPEIEPNFRMMAGYAFWKLPLHADWFIFAKDDTLLIMDQLKRTLAGYDAGQLYVGTFGTEKVR